MAIVHLAIVFPYQWARRHFLRLLKHTMLPLMNGQPYEQLLLRVQRSEQQLSQSYLMIRLLREWHLLKLFSRHQRKRFLVSTGLPRLRHTVVEYLSFHRRGAIHAAHNRKPIRSIDSAVPLIGDRRDVLKQIFCLALLP